MIKKIISLVLMLALVSGILNITLITAAAKTDEKFTYDIMDDGTAKLTDYTDTETEVLIPTEIDGYTVTEIGEKTFKDNQDITAITISENIAEIEEDTFQHLDDLTIHCYQDSYAESFAQKEEINYVFLIDRISIIEKRAILNTGCSKTLTTTVSPLSAFNKLKSWSSSDTKVATVDQNGKITAKSKGTVKITAQTLDGSQKTDTCIVTVKQPVEKIKIKQKNIKLDAGKSKKINTAVLPKDANNNELKWTSSNKKVATVDKNGMVTAKNRGIAKITAKSTDGSKITAKCRIIVRQPVTKVTLSNKSTTLKIGDEVTLKATVKPKNANNKNLKWSVADNKVASVSKDGKVTAKDTGSTTVYAKTADGSKKQAKCTVTVKNAIELTEREKDILMRSLYREAGSTSYQCKLYVCSATLNLWKKNYSHMSLESMLRSYNIFSTAYTLDSVTASEKAIVKPAVEQILKYGTVSDVKYFRTCYYHSFGTPVININNVYFSK